MKQKTAHLSESQIKRIIGLHRGESPLIHLAPICEISDICANL